MLPFLLPVDCPLTCPCLLALASPPFTQPARKSSTTFCVGGTLCLCDKLPEDEFRKKAGDRFPKSPQSVRTGLVPPQSLAYISTGGFSSPTACRDRSLHSFRIPGPAPQSESLPCHHHVVLLLAVSSAPPPTTYTSVHAPTYKSKSGALPVQLLNLIPLHLEQFLAFLLFVLSIR